MKSYNNLIELLLTPQKSMVDLVFLYDIGNILNRLYQIHYIISSDISAIITTVLLEACLITGRV